MKTGQLKLEKSNGKHQTGKTKGKIKTGQLKRENENGKIQTGKFKREN